MRYAPFSRGVSPEVYWECHSQLAKQLLEHPTTQVLVACDPNDAEHLYGAIVHQPGRDAVVHWVYVKGAFRRLGLASVLLAAAIGDRRPIVATQLSGLFYQVPSLVEKHEILYCPYLLVGIHPTMPAKTPEVDPMRG